MSPIRWSGSDLSKVFLGFRYFLKVLLLSICVSSSLIRSNSKNTEQGWFYDEWRTKQGWLYERNPLQQRCFLKPYIFNCLSVRESSLIKSTCLMKERSLLCLKNCGRTISANSSGFVIRNAVPSSLQSIIEVCSLLLTRNNFDVKYFKLPPILRAMNIETR